MPEATSIDVSREELLARAVELGKLARSLGLGYLADTHDAERLSIDELRAHLLGLEAAMAIKP